MTAAARKAFDEAVALENSGDMNKALASYLKAQELSPQDTEIAYRTATALLQSGYLEEAQSQLRRIVFTEPDHQNARTSLGNCQFLMGDYVNASMNFREVLELDPTNRNALFGQASLFLRNNKHAEAEKLATRLLEQLPSSAAALSLLADCQFQTKQQASAIATYRKALKIDENYVPALLGMSEALLLGKRFEEVIRHTVKAGQLTPNDPRTFELLSDALAGTGELEDAYEAAETALKLGPANLPALVRLSVLSRKLGRYTSALRFGLAAHDTDQNAQEPFNALGAALASLKHSKKARDVLTAKNAGKELDPEIREFIEHQIKNETSKASQAATEASSHGAIGATPAPDGFVDASVTEETAPDVQRKSVVTVSDDEYQLPNVLGLSRQDKS